MGPKANLEKADHRAKNGGNRKPVWRKDRENVWRKDKEVPQGFKGTPKKTAAEVMPNSLQANVGKPGYDEDGVRLLCNEAGRYNWPETA